MQMQMHKSHTTAISSVSEAPRKKSTSAGLSLADNTSTRMATVVGGGCRVTRRRMHGDKGKENGKGREAGCQVTSIQRRVQLTQGSDFRQRYIDIDPTKNAMQKYSHRGQPGCVVVHLDQMTIRVYLDQDNELGAFRIHEPGASAEGMRRGGSCSQEGRALSGTNKKQTVLLLHLSLPVWLLVTVYNPLKK